MTESYPHYYTLTAFPTCASNYPQRPFMDTLWNTVLSDLQLDVTKGAFLMYLKQTKLESIEDKTATISTPTFIIASQVEKKYGSIIKTALEKKSGIENLNLRFTYGKSSIKPTKSDPGPLFDNTPIARSINPRIKPEYTFETLAVSDSNQLAYTACKTVATSPGSKYNPLFMYGTVGVGKTHLMHAIANEVFAKNPMAKILYLTTEEFTNEVVEAIMNKSTQNVRRKFRQTNLLLLDDIQFLTGKEKVQEELFHTFNALIDGGGQIVFSSDRPPSELKKIEARLASRFEGGLTVDIQPPDFELRAAILLIKARKHGIELTTDTAKTIAERVENTRALEGFLLKIATSQASKKRPITHEETLLLLGEKVDKSKFLHPDDIISAICNFYNIKSTQLKGERRSAIFVKPRQICMYILKEDVGLSLVEIGNLLGGRDHTTVMHGIDKTAEKLSVDTRLSDEVKAIRDIIAG